MIEQELRDCLKNYESLIIEILELDQKINVTQAKQLEAKDKYDSARQAILLKYAENPKELGGNEHARNAKIAELIKDEQAAVTARTDDLTCRTNELASKTRMLRSLEFRRDILIAIASSTK